MTKIVVHIDRLVLRGVDPHHARAIADGLKAELTRQLANQTNTLDFANSSARLSTGRQHVGGALGVEMGALLAPIIVRRLVR